MKNRLCELMLIASFLISVALLFSIQGCITPNWPPWDDGTTTTTTSTTTTTIPPVTSGDDPTWVSTAGMVVQYKDLEQTCAAKLLSSDGTGFLIESAESPSWPVVDGFCDGHICATWIHDGERVAYYWDDHPVQSPYKFVSLQHFLGAEWAADRPTPGQVMGLFFVSEAGQYRSNIMWTTYPGE